MSDAEKVADLAADLSEISGQPLDDVLAIVRGPFVKVSEHPFTVSIVTPKGN